MSLVSTVQTVPDGRGYVSVLVDGRVDIVAAGEHATGLTTTLHTVASIRLPRGATPLTHAWAAGGVRRRSACRRSGAAALLAVATRNAVHTYALEQEQEQEQEQQEQSKPSIAADDDVLRLVHVDAVEMYFECKAVDVITHTPLAGQAVVAAVPPPPPMGGGLWASRPQPIEQLIAAAGSDGVEIHPLPSHALSPPVHLLQGTPICCLRFSSDGGLLAVAATTGHIGIWNAKTISTSVAAVWYRSPGTGNPSQVPRVTCVEFSGGCDPTHLALGRWDGSAQVFTRQQQRPGSREEEEGDADAGVHAHHVWVECLKSNGSVADWAVPAAANAVTAASTAKADTQALGGTHLAWMAVSGDDDCNGHATPVLVVAHGTGPRLVPYDVRTGCALSQSPWSADDGLAAGWPNISGMCVVDANGLRVVRGPALVHARIAPVGLVFMTDSDGRMLSLPLAKSDRSVCEAVETEEERERDRRTSPPCRRRRRRRRRHHPRLVHSMCGEAVAIDDRGEDADSDADSDWGLNAGDVPTDPAPLRLLVRSWSARASHDREGRVLTIPFLSSRSLFDESTGAPPHLECYFAANGAVRAGRGATRFALSERHLAVLISPFVCLFDRLKETWRRIFLEPLGGSGARHCVADCCFAGTRHFVALTSTGHVHVWELMAVDDCVEGLEPVPASRDQRIRGAAIDSAAMTKRDDGAGGGGGGGGGGTSAMADALREARAEMKMLGLDEKRRTNPHREAATTLLLPHDSDFFSEGVDRQGAAPFERGRLSGAVSTGCFAVLCPSHGDASRCLIWTATVAENVEFGDSDEISLATEAVPGGEGLVWVGISEDGTTVAFRSKEADDEDFDSGQAGDGTTTTTASGSSTSWWLCHATDRGYLWQVLSMPVGANPPTNDVF